MTNVMRPLLDAADLRRMFAASLSWRSGTPYKLVLPANRDQDEPPVLDTVHHVVHVPEARRILEDRYLRAGLVCDDSRVNRSRMCVTWLSANTWALGSIYGTVQFTFRWQDIVENRDIYWVEAMTEYHPTAYRFLITDRDLSASSLVTPL